MSTLVERLAAAKAEYERLEREAATATCAEVGHRWVLEGGRNAGCEYLGKDCSCSVPVYSCTVCKDCDYGDNAEAEDIMADCHARAG